ncbi:DJ-1 family glyoxalase III [uncultured Robinsoniella sp.]|uniref:DJ-1 family glyoxalase III n=1 Tax=uncultured Robinsoniella sp. TaxID=904190 RepID=UPI00374E5E5A
MSKIYIFLAEGFEEIEGLTVVDLLRRGKLDITMISMTGVLAVTGSHGICVTADAVFEETDFSDARMYVLPGGMPGTLHLGNHKGLVDLLKEAHAKNGKIAAICAAPSVLGTNGILEGKRAVCYPGFEDKLLGAQVLNDPVAVDGNIITSRGLGTAIEFSLAIISEFLGEEEAQRIAESIIYK